MIQETFRPSNNKLKETASISQVKEIIEEIKIKCLLLLIQISTIIIKIGKWNTQQNK